MTMRGCVVDSKARKSFKRLPSTGSVMLNSLGSDGHDERRWSAFEGLVSLDLDSLPQEMPNERTSAANSSTSRSRGSTTMIEDGAR